MGIYRQKISKQHFNAKLPSGESAQVHKDQFAYKMGRECNEGYCERKYVAPTVRAWEKAGESPKGKFVTGCSDEGKLYSQIQEVDRYPYDNPAYVEEYPSETFGILYKAGRSYRIDPLAAAGKEQISEVPLHVEHWHNMNRTVRTNPQDDGEGKLAGFTMRFYEDGNLILQTNYCHNVAKFGSAFLANANA